MKTEFLLSLIPVRQAFSSTIRTRPFSPMIHGSSQEAPSPKIREDQIETSFIAKLQDLKYTARPDIHDRATL